MKRLQNIHFILEGWQSSGANPTLIFHFSQDGKLIMAEIMNRNYRSRNLSSTVLKLPKYFHLTKFSLCGVHKRKLIKDLISSSFPSGFDFGQKWCSRSREKTVKIAYFSWQTNPTIISKIALFCTLRCSSISIFEFFTLFLLH